MKVKPGLVTSLIVLTSLSWADCQFKIINYTQSPITAAIGFYGGTSKTLVVAPTSTAIEKLASNWQCTDSTDYGSGVSFIRFPNDPDLAGANYAPEQSKINLLGRDSGAANGRFVTADDGKSLWLTNRGVTINKQTFEVKLERTQQANSKVAGTN
jgi:hypothetical protein